MSLFFRRAAVPALLTVALLSGCVPLTATNGAGSPVNPQPAPGAPPRKPAAPGAANSAAPQAPAPAPAAPGAAGLDSAQEALRIAAAAFPHGTVTELDFHESTAQWRVTMSDGSQEQQVVIDRERAAAVPLEAPEFLDHDELHLTTQLRVTLAAALEHIPEQLRGALLEANLESYGPQLLWELTLVPAGSPTPTRIFIDAVTGELT